MSKRIRVGDTVRYRRKGMGRAGCPCKLTLAQRETVRSSDTPSRILAALYQVTSATINNIRRYTYV